MILLALFALLTFTVVFAAFFAESSTDTYVTHISETDPWHIDWGSEDI
jgi:hypothetical protein